MIETCITHRIPFHDLDLMTVVWHGHYFKYFELARTALMQKLDLDWPACKALGYAMPVVEINAEYRLPLRYDEEIRVRAFTDAPMLPALIIHYEITSADGKTTHATGMTKQVYVSIQSLRLSFSVPEAISERLGKSLIALTGVKD